MTSVRPGVPVPPHSTPQPCRPAPGATGAAPQAPAGPAIQPLPPQAKAGFGTPVASRAPGVTIDGAPRRSRAGAALPDCFDGQPALPEAGRSAILQAHPDPGPAARKWMNAHIQAHLHQQVDSSELRLVAFSSREAAARLDTRHLMSEIGLDELPLHQRQRDDIHLLAEDGSFGAYHQDDLEQDDALLSTSPRADHVATDGRPGRLIHSRFPVAQLLDAMNGFTAHPANELGNLFYANHVPVSTEFRRRYVQDYVRNVTGQDVDPERTFILAFDRAAGAGGSTPASGATDAFRLSQNQGGYWLMELFERHVARAGTIADMKDRLRVVSRTDLATARATARADGQPEGDQSPMASSWFEPPIDTDAFLASMAAVHERSPQSFELGFKPRLANFWRGHQRALALAEQKRALDYANMANDAGAFSPDQFKLVESIFSGQVPEHVQVFPVAFPALPTSALFAGLRIEDQRSGLKILYLPGGQEPIKAFALDQQSDRARQDQQIRQWVADKIVGEVWKMAITQPPSQAGAAGDALAAGLAGFSEAPLQGNVFEALVARRVELETTSGVALVGQLHRQPTIESLHTHWNTASREQFNAMGLDEQRSFLENQHPPVDELASQYARAFISKHFGLEINPDDTYLMEFPGKSFVIQFIDRLTSGKLHTVPGLNTDGRPSSTVEFARKVSLTDLFKVNWGGAAGRLLARGSTELFKIFTANQLAPAGVKYNYRNTPSVIAPAALFACMTRSDGAGNEFVKHYRALRAQFWTNNLDHIATYSRNLALHAIDAGMSAGTLNQDERDLLHEAFTGQADRNRNVSVSRLSVGGHESVNALVIENHDQHAQHRVYLYLPGAHGEKIKAFPRHEHLARWLLQLARNKDDLDQFLQHHFSRNDADNRTASWTARSVRDTLTELAGQKPPYITQLPARNTSKGPVRQTAFGAANAIGLHDAKSISGAPFQALAQDAMDKDGRDLAFETNDNGEQKTASLVDLFNNLPLPILGSVIGLSAGKGEEKRTAWRSLAYDIAGTAVGIGAGRLVGQALKPVGNALFGGAVTNGTDTAAGITVPLVLEQHRAPDAANAKETPATRLPLGMTWAAPRNKPHPPAMTEPAAASESALPPTASADQDPPQPANGLQAGAPPAPAATRPAGRRPLPPGARLNELNMVQRSDIDQVFVVRVHDPDRSHVTAAAQLASDTVLTTAPPMMSGELLVGSRSIDAALAVARDKHPGRQYDIFAIDTKGLPVAWLRENLDYNSTALARREGESASTYPLLQQYRASEGRSGQGVDFDITHLRRDDATQERIRKISWDGASPLPADLAQ